MYEAALQQMKETSRKPHVDNMKIETSKSSRTVEPRSTDHFSARVHSVDHCGMKNQPYASLHLNQFYASDQSAVSPQVEEYDTKDSHITSKMGTGASFSDEKEFIQTAPSKAGNSTGLPNNRKKFVFKPSPALGVQRMPRDNATDSEMSIGKSSRVNKRKLFTESSSPLEL